MSEIEFEILKNDVATLVPAVSQQALLIKALADQVNTLLSVSISMVSVIKDQNDLDLVRRRSLRDFSDPLRDKDVAAYLYAIFETAFLHGNNSSGDEIISHKERVTKARFQVIEGGKQADRNE